MWHGPRETGCRRRVETRYSIAMKETVKQAESDAWTAELQAGMEARRLEELRASLCDEDPEDDGIPPVGRARAIRYTIRAVPCDCDRRVRA